MCTVLSAVLFLAGFQPSLAASPSCPTCAFPIWPLSYRLLLPSPVFVPDISLSSLSGRTSIPMGQNTHGRKKKKKDSFFNDWCWSNCMSACRRIHIDLYCTKLRSVWISGLRSTEPDRRQGGGATLNSDTGKDFLDRTPVAQGLRTTIHKWDLMRRFCMARDTIIQTKRLPTKLGVYQLYIWHRISI